MVANDHAFLSAAQQLLACGIYPVPVNPGTAVPAFKGWQTQHLSADQLPAYWANGNPNDLAALFGPASGEVVSCDLDAPEASELGRLLLPTNTPAWGHSGQLRHVLLRAPGAQRLQLTYAGETICELLANGDKAECPPTRHSSGQLREWLPQRGLADVPIFETTASAAAGWVRILAGAALLLRHWRWIGAQVQVGVPGSRHDLIRHVCGAMLHAGWQPDAVQQVLGAVLQLSGDEELPDRARVVVDTIQRQQDGETFSGLPSLAAVLPEPLLAKLVEWWGLGTGVDVGVAGPLPVMDAGAGELEVIRAADVQMESVEWLWLNRLPLGKLSIIVGHPGLGKSQLTMWLAAVATRGWPFPDGAPPCPTGSVVILSGEDGTEDTITPRLAAAGAVLERCHIVRSVRIKGKPRLFTLERDLEALDALLSKLGDVVLVILDPLSVYMGKTDQHNAGEVRVVLAPLAELMDKHGCAGVVVSHFNKGSGDPSGGALMRLAGSGAFGAAARAVYGVLVDPDQDDQPVFLPIKVNLAPPMPGLLFRTVQAVLDNADSNGRLIEASKIEWQPGLCMADANELLSRKPVTQDRETEQQRAATLLLELLQAGPVPVKELQDAANGHGLSWRTVERAKQALPQIRAHKTAAGWQWQLEVAIPTTPPRPTPPNGGEVGGVEPRQPTPPASPTDGGVGLDGLGGDGVAVEVGSPSTSTGGAVQPSPALTEAGPA